MAYYIHQCCISAQFVVHRGHLPWVTAAEKITVLESGWAAPADVVLPGVGLAALAAADGPLPPGWSRAKAELHSPRRQPVALAAWMIARLESVEAAESALHYVAPVGEKEDYVARAMRNIPPYLHEELAKVPAGRNN